MTKQRPLLTFAVVAVAALLGGCASEPGSSGGLADLLGGGAPPTDIVCYHREAQCPAAAGQQVGDSCFCTTPWGYLKGQVRAR